MDNKTILIGLLLFSAVMFGAHFLVSNVESIRPDANAFNFTDMRR